MKRADPSPNGHQLPVTRSIVVIAVAPGDYGKPRPMVVVQSDLFNETHASVIACPITSDAQDLPMFRIPVLPSPENGLSVPSQVMADKVMAISRRRISRVIGRLNADDMTRVDRALRLCLQL